MNLVAIFILGSISLVLPAGTDCSRTQRPGSELDVRHSAPYSASGSALDGAHTSCPGPPDLADPDARGEEDDPFDDEVHSASPSSSRVLSTCADQSTDRRLSRCPAHLGPHPADPLLGRSRCQHTPPCRLGLHPRLSVRHDPGAN